MVSYLKKWQRPADYTEVVDDFALRAVASLSECHTWLIACGYEGDGYIVHDPTTGTTTLVCPQCKNEVSNGKA